MSFSKPIDDTMIPPNVTLKTNPDGSENPKYIDLLDEDRAIAGQKFACLSFISPEHIIKQKDHFFFENFIKMWDISKSLEKFTQFLNFMAYKYRLDFDKISEDFKDFSKDEKEKIMSSTIEDDYKNFLDEHEERLEKEFGEAHSFQTSVRGIKVRGVFPTQQEAELATVQSEQPVEVEGLEKNTEAIDSNTETSSKTQKGMSNLNDGMSKMAGAMEEGVGIDIETMSSVKVDVTGVGAAAKEFTSEFEAVATRVAKAEINAVLQQLARTAGNSEAANTFENAIK